LTEVDGSHNSPARSVAPYAAATAVIWLAGTGLCAALATGAARGPVLAGAVAALASAAVALTGLAIGVRKGVNGLLAGFSAGFLARMAAVAVGLIASRAEGHAALLYAASFFGFYALSQAIEIAFVWSSSRAQRASQAKA
jgi:hypothetical protein